VLAAEREVTMSEQALKAQVREEIGGSAVKRLRKAGMIPCVMYGMESESVSLKINKLDFIHLLHSLTSEHALIKLDVNNKKKDVILKSIDYHPFKNEISHVDFHQVSMDKPIETTVPVEEVGNSKGIAAGGVVEHVMRELSIECLPKDIPSVIEVDITELEIGDSVHVADIVAPKGVKLLDDPEQVVISVAAPRIMALEEVSEGAELGAVAEPELIRKREKEVEE